MLYVGYFAKFTYNEYIRPYFLSHVVSTIFGSDLPALFIDGICVVAHALATKIMIWGDGLLLVAMLLTNG